MSETQQLHNNSNGSIQSPHKIEENLNRMKLNEENTEQSSPYPDRPGERDCQFFLRTGQCAYGNTCRYNHPLTHPPHGVTYYYEDLPERIGQPDCEYFLKTGACKYGPTCKYHHPEDRNGAGPVSFNLLGYPIRQGEKSCPYYMQKGICRFGVACKFHHPYPHSPPNGHSSTTYGTSSFPSIGFPYTGGVMMMPFPTATYGAMPPQVSQPQAYLPFMLTPSQGLLPPQGWPTYMAPSNSISSASVTSHQHSSPEKAECRYFMNTGTCKYGDDCKYSHPKERMLQSQPNLLNPIVLPLRPGEPACVNFITYGFCKFGANCKFDHLMPPNHYNNVGLITPTAYALPVSNHLEISVSPSSSDSTTLSNGEAAENQSSETEKQEESSTAQPEKSGESDSNLTKPDADNLSIETEKAENSKVQDSTALPIEKLDADSPSKETEKAGNSEVQDSS